MRRDVFQAIADPTRRAIISMVMIQAMTPNTLAERFDTTRQAVSKHIRILSECGLLKGEQLGREIFYRAETEKLIEVDMWLEPFRQMWDGRFAQLDDVLDQMKQNKVRS